MAIIYLSAIYWLTMGCLWAGYELSIDWLSDGNQQARGWVWGAIDSLWAGNWYLLAIYMYGLGMGWVWAGYGLAMGWLWPGYGLSMGWLWAGYELAISSLLAGHQLAMGW